MKSLAKHFSVSRSKHTTDKICYIFAAYTLFDGFEYMPQPLSSQTSPTLAGAQIRTDQPCLCLCFGFSQIILIFPFLLITLHFSQIGFTDDLTFMLNPPFKKTVLHYIMQSGQMQALYENIFQKRSNSLLFPVTDIISGKISQTILFISPYDPTF